MSAYETKDERVKGEAGSAYLGAVEFGWGGSGFGLEAQWRYSHLREAWPRRKDDGPKREIECVGFEPGSESGSEFGSGRLGSGHVCMTCWVGPIEMPLLRRARLGRQLQGCPSLRTGFRSGRLWSGRQWRFEDREIWLQFVPWRKGGRCWCWRLLEEELVVEVELPILEDRGGQYELAEDLETSRKVEWAVARMTMGRPCVETE